MALNEAIKIVGIVYRSDQLSIHGEIPDQYGPINPIKNDDYELMPGVAVGPAQQRRSDASCAVFTNFPNAQ